MKVIIKHPEDVYGHFWHIGGDLKELQQIVGGYVEVVTLNTTPRLLVMCDEEGKLKEKAHCLNAGGLVDFVGTIIICGEGFTDFPMHFENWMELLNEWRASNGGNDS